MNNKIFIIGAGAVGKALAVFLKLEGKDVSIIRGSVDNQPNDRELIKVQMADDSILQAEIEISSLSDHANFDGILVLANKSYGNEKLAESLLNRAKNNPIVLLQNGLGVEAPFMKLGFTKIYRAVLFTTCQLVSNNLVKFKPVAISQIGILKGKIVELQFVVNQINNTIFKFAVNENIQPIIWKKAIANCVFNSICPLLENDNGVFLRNDNVLELAKKVISECVKVAINQNINLTEKEVLDNVLMISKMSDGQLISTLQDMRNKRKTEIETLNFAIVNYAKQAGNELDVTTTRLLGELIKLKAELNR